MIYADIRDYVKEQFAERGWDNPMPTFSPGPASDQIIQKCGPGKLIFLTVGGGSSMTTEDLFDRPFITTRCVGSQMNYDMAEKLAWDLDYVLTSVVRNTLISSSSALYIQRSGGGPQLLSMDVANRYHFTGSYITESQRKVRQ